jgi:lysosomal acid lipase/cholesteryl ester hydrolase
MKFKKIILFSSIGYVCYKAAVKLVVDPETLMSDGQRYQKYGLKMEKHYVTTDDDYIINIHRVTNPELTSSQPVFLLHGFIDSSSCWIANGEKSGAVILAKNGFDVWMPNCRGNKFSRLHKYLNPNYHPEFWDFTFEEMALYDTKATIERIKEITG